MSSLGFTGTANGMTPKQEYSVRMIVAFLSPQAVHHGDCVGADATFHDVCVDNRALIHIHPPTNPRKRAWKQGAITHPQRAYLDRNQDIVDASDLLLATPGEDIEQLRSGTWATIRRARKKRIPIILVLPDGSVRREEPQ